MKILIEVGFILNITEKVSQQRFRAKVIGIYDHSFLIIELFDSEVHVKLTKEQAVVIRYFHEGLAYGFESMIVEIDNYHDDIFFIKYPYNIEKFNVRDVPRVPCLLPAVFEINNEKINGSVVDLSIKGCKFTSSEFSNYEKTVNLIHQKAKIWFLFPGFQESVAVLCEIKNIEVLKNLVTIGIMFTDSESKLLPLIYSLTNSNISKSDIVFGELDKMKNEKTSLPVKNGEDLHIEFENSSKQVLAILIGLKEKNYLIIKLKHEDTDKQNTEILTKNYIFKVRYNYGGYNFYFISRLLHKIVRPFKLYLINYPLAVEMYSIRSYPRVPCLLPAKLYLKDVFIDGSIIDISKSGCKFVSNKEIKFNMKSPLPGELFNIILKLPGFEGDLQVNVIIKNCEFTEDKNFLGVLFINMNKTTSNYLEQYITYHININKLFVDEYRIIENMCNTTQVFVKKNFYLFVSKDIEDGLMWIFSTLFKGLINVITFKNYNNLISNIANNDFNLLIVDLKLTENISEFVSIVNNKGRTFKILLFLLNEEQKKGFTWLKEFNFIEEVIARPFTQEDIYTFLLQSFGFGLPKIINVNTENFKKGLVIASDINKLHSSDVLIEAGTILDINIVNLLLDNKLEHIEVHEGGENFLNCWEFNSCKYYGVCPASTYADSDGFFGGKNAGRACMFIKNTFSHTNSNFVFDIKTYNEKLEKRCKHCDFYKALIDENSQAMSLELLKQYINNKKGGTAPV